MPGRGHPPDHLAVVGPQRPPRLPGSPVDVDVQAVAQGCTYECRQQRQHGMIFEEHASSLQLVDLHSTSWLGGPGAVALLEESNASLHSLVVGVARHSALVKREQLGEGKAGSGRVFIVNEIHRMGAVQTCHVPTGRRRGSHLALHRDTSPKLAVWPPQQWPHDWRPARRARLGPSHLATPHHQ